MFVRRLADCEEFLSGDMCRLREFLHPDKHDVELRYSLAHAVLHPGESSATHRLRTSEVYFIIEGNGTMVISGEEREVGPDDMVYIPPMHWQHLVNTGESDLKFLCIVDPAWREADEELR